MRARSTVLLVLALVLTSLFVVSSPVAHAADSILLAQETEDSESSDEGDTTDADEGSGSAEAESGANEGQTEAAEEETGPPWTYQMARMILVMLLLMAAAIGLLYWRLVVQRQRRGV